MDPLTLAQAMGLYRWQVKRHFKPGVFKKLEDETLREYARIFRVSVDALRHFHGEEWALKPPEHRQYAHCESGVVTTLLKRHGLDLSEPMVFGITGGLTFAYLPLIKITNMPIISYRMFPGSIIKGAVKHLDARFRTQRYREKGEALAELTGLVDGGEMVGLQTSVYWLPYFPPEMRFQFNAHNLIVYGREGNEFLVSDPIFDHPVRIRHGGSPKCPLRQGGPCPEGFHVLSRPCQSGYRSEQGDTTRRSNGRCT